MSYPKTVTYYPNNPFGLGNYGLMVCPDPDSGNNAGSLAGFKYMYTYSSAELSTISVDDANYVELQWNTMWGSGTDCCGKATPLTPCGGYGCPSVCPNYLGWTTYFSLCQCVTPPGICVPMLPCKNYGFHLSGINITSRAFTSVLSTVKIAPSASVSTTYYLYVYNPTGSSGNYWDLLTSQASTGTTKVTLSATITDAKYSDNGLIHIIATGGVVGGQSFKLRAYYSDAFVTYTLPDPKIELKSGQLKSGELK